MTNTIYEQNNFRITMYVSSDNKTKILTTEKRDSTYSGWYEMGRLNIR